MAILVYKLTCTVSGKVYVGITARALDTRWFEHCKRAKEGVRNSRLYAAMRKYGLDTFAREIIATTDTEADARLFERHYIKEYGSFDSGYNSNEGGYGFLHFPEHIRRKISEAQIGKVMSVESRARMSLAKKGKSECADNFGVHTQKGSGNPRAASYIIRFPDGSEQLVTGLRAFCKQTGIFWQTLLRGQKSKGYAIVRRAEILTSPDADSALHLKEI